MRLTSDAITEHREATMPEILARNAEYEALPELVRRRAQVGWLQKQLLSVWNIARDLPHGPERERLLDASSEAMNLPVEFTIQHARQLS